MLDPQGVNHLVAASRAWQEKANPLVRETHSTKLSYLKDAPNERATICGSLSFMWLVFTQPSFFPCPSSSPPRSPPRKAATAVSPA
jgi:hypothetical protein